MANESEAAAPGTRTDEMPRSPYALLIELEGAAVEARRAEYEALRSVLSGQKVKITPHHFVRYCLNTTPVQYLPALLDVLGGKRNGAAEMAEEIRNGIALFLSSDEAALQPQLKAMWQHAHQRHMDVALLTCAKEAVVRALMEKWATPRERARVISFEPGGKCFPRADVWLKAAKNLSRTPRQCVVVSGSQLSMRTALSAGMRCIVMPDEFTAFQDFSGADIVLDDQADMEPATALDAVAPLKPFI